MVAVRMFSDTLAGPGLIGTGRQAEPLIQLRPLSPAPTYSNARNALHNRALVVASTAHHEAVHVEPRLQPEWLRFGASHAGAAMQCQWGVGIKETEVVSFIGPRMKCNPETVSGFCYRDRNSVHLVRKLIAAARFGK